ncbi:MAG: hypothetical protein ACLFRX_04270 [Gemmatimonadota bacterium]
MRPVTIVMLAALAVSACGETDVQDRGGEPAPGEEVEDMGLERKVEPVNLDTVAWFSEGRTVTFENRNWILAGEPVFDPAVVYVGEFEGTPLYAEVGEASPHDALFIPLENDYWQLLEPGTAPPPE